MCVYTCTWPVHWHARTHACTHTVTNRYTPHTHTRTHAHTRTRAHTPHTQSHTHTHTHKHTNTHTHVSVRVWTNPSFPVAFLHYSPSTPSSCPPTTLLPPCSPPHLFAGHGTGVCRGQCPHVEAIVTLALLFARQTLGHVDAVVRHHRNDAGDAGVRPNGVPGSNATFLGITVVVARLAHVVLVAVLCLRTLWHTVRTVLLVLTLHTVVRALGNTPGMEAELRLLAE